MIQVRALLNLTCFEDLSVRAPEEWAGERGHPLRVIASFASHLFGRYSTPRFMASAWFAQSSAQGRWFIAHAQGRPLRSLDLPMAMTRRMEHILLRTPDHYALFHALRRAEVIGLGGRPELAAVILTTRLAEDFANRDRWRDVLAWLVRCGESVELAQVRPLIDYFHRNLNDIDLKGRTFASMMRAVSEWHEWLGRRHTRCFSWPRSRWNGMVLPIHVSEPRKAEWTLVELLDSRELVHEGRAMRHCVASYAQSCLAKGSSIWSLRHRWCDEPTTRSVLTVEIRPNVGTIVQIRGKANAPAHGEPLRLVRMWAAREGLRFHPSLRAGDALER